MNIDEDKIKAFAKKILLEQGDQDLDLKVFDLVEIELGRKLEQIEKANIRWKLDLDRASLNAYEHKFEYDKEQKKKWR